MKVGVVVNPASGQGHILPSVISRLEESWSDHVLMAPAGPAAACFHRAVLLPEPQGGYVERIQSGVDALLDALYVAALRGRQQGRPGEQRGVAV